LRGKNEKLSRRYYVRQTHSLKGKSGFPLWEKEMKRVKEVCLFLMLIVFASVMCVEAQWEKAQMNRLTVDTIWNSLERQSLGIDKCDKLYLCYRESGRIFFTSKEGHRNWTSPEEVSFGDQASYKYAMAVNSDTGIALMTFIRYGGGGGLFYGNNSGGTWEFTTIDSFAYGDYGGRTPAIAIDSSGNVHLLWMVTYYDTSLSDYFSKIIYSTNASGDWVDQVVYFSPGRFNGINPLLEVEKEGVAHVMWGVGNIYHMNNDTLGGMTWRADTLWQFPIIYWWFIDFKVDQSNNLHMIVEGFNYWGGPRYLYYYFRPGGSDHWGNPELVSDKGCVGRIAFDRQGNVHLVWTEADGNFCGWAMYYSYKDQQGWSSYEIVGENFNYQYYIDELWTSFVIDSDQRGHLVFAACESLPVLYDSNEVFYYAAPNLYNIEDIVFLINYLYVYGPAPSCRREYDLNCDKQINIADVIVLINYLFVGASLPEC
jgi:hypothetical protein